MLPVSKIKNWNIQWLFGTSIVFLSSFIVTHEVTKNRFYSNVESSSLKEGWELRGKEQNPIQTEITLPYDLVKIANLDSWTLTKTIEDISIFDRYSDSEAALILGKI